MESGYLTTTEAGRLIGCCRNHVKKLIREGQLAAHQIGSQWRITREAVQALLDARQAKTAGAA